MGSAGPVASHLWAALCGGGSGSSHPGRRFFVVSFRDEIMALVLNRKPGERIRVRTTAPECGSVVITVSEIRRGRVRIAVEAPDEMVITREDVDGARQTGDGTARPRTEPCSL